MGDGVRRVSPKLGPTVDGTDSALADAKSRAHSPRHDGDWYSMPDTRELSLDLAGREGPTYASIEPPVTISGRDLRGDPSPEYFDRDLRSPLSNVDVLLQARVAALFKRDGEKARSNGLAFLVASEGMRVLPVDDQKAAITILEKLPGSQRLLRDALSDPRGIITKGEGGTTPLRLIADFVSNPQIDPRIEGGEGYAWGLLRNFAKPETINQGSRGRCSATAQEYAMALRHPVELARAYIQLASPSGVVDLLHGQSRRNDTAFESDGPDESVPSRLMQAMLMDVGRAEGSYDNRDDRVHIRFSVFGLHIIDDLTDGVTHEQAARISSVVDRPSYSANSRLDIGLDVLAERTRRGETYVVPAGLRTRFPGEGHAVAIVKVENDKVYFRESSGPRLDGAYHEASHPFFPNTKSLGDSVWCMQRSTFLALADAIVWPR